MTDLDGGSSGLPDFAWIPEQKGLAKLLMSADKKQAAAQGRSLRFLVYPWGITWINGSHETAGRWEEMTQVWQTISLYLRNGAHERTEYGYKIQLADGRTWTFQGALRGRAAARSEAEQPQRVPGTTVPVTVEQLGRLVTDAVTRIQLPKAIERFNAGQSLSFGPLTVDPAGISAGDQSLAWDEIEDVRTRQGVVTVKKAGKWLSWHKVGVSQIPNYFVFDVLVRAILARRQPAR